MFTIHQLVQDFATIHSIDLFFRYLIYMLMRSTSLMVKYIYIYLSVDEI